MKKIFYVFLFTGFLNLLNAQSTWEYFHRNADEEERIVSVEEVNKDTLITVSNVLHVKGDENKAKGIIRYISNKTGEVLAEKEYKIDSLGTKFEKIFYNKKSRIFVIVGSAYKKENNKKKGYFISTVWDDKLNLIKENIFRFSPYSEKNYLWYIDGYTINNGKILLLGISTSDLKVLKKDRKELLLIVNPNDGTVEKTIWFIHDLRFSGYHSAVVENIKKDNEYILVGAIKSYKFNEKFELIDSFFNYPDFHHILFYSYTVRKFQDDKYLLNIAYDGNGESYNKGLAYFDQDFYLDKKSKISLIEYNFDFPIARRNFDFIDTSTIYAGCQDGYFKYYILSKFNSNLHPYWIKYFGDDGKGRMLWNTTATSDGGVILSGSKGKYREYLLPEKQGAWIQKFDSDGNTVSTTELTPNAWSITVYPNPSQGAFIINIEGKAQNVKLELYDMQGRVAKKFTGLIQGKNRLDMYDIPHGIYVWQLKRAGKILGTGKWVKE